MVTTWMGDCLRAGEQSRYWCVYITKAKVNLAFHPSEVGKSSTGLSGARGAFTCVGWQVELYDSIWQVTLCDGSSITLTF